MSCPYPPSCPVQTCPIERCPTLVCPTKKDDALVEEKTKNKKDVVMECEDEALPRWVWITVPCLVIGIVILLIAIFYIVYKFVDYPGQKLGKCCCCCSAQKERGAPLDQSVQNERPVQLVIDESSVLYLNSTGAFTRNKSIQTTVQDEKPVQLVLDETPNDFW